MEGQAGEQVGNRLCKQASRVAAASTARAANRLQLHPSLPGCSTHALHSAHVYKQLTEAKGIESSQRHAEQPREGQQRPPARREQRHRDVRGRQQAAVPHDSPLTHCIPVHEPPRAVQAPPRPAAHQDMHRSHRASSWICRRRRRPRALAAGAGASQLRPASWRMQASTCMPTWRHASARPRGCRAERHPV